MCVHCTCWPSTGSGHCIALAHLQTFHHRTLGMRTEVGHPSMSRRRWSCKSKDFLRQTRPDNRDLKRAITVPLVLWKVRIFSQIKFDINTSYMLSLVDHATSLHPEQQSHNINLPSQLIMIPEQSVQRWFETNASTLILYSHPVLDGCWESVRDAGPTFSHHRDVHSFSFTLRCVFFLLSSYEHYSNYNSPII